MKRHDCCLALFLGVLLLPLHCQSQESSRSARPNIVVLVADDLSTFTLGCYGDPSLSTELKAMMLALDQWMRDTSDFLPPPATFPQVPSIKNVTLELMLDGPLPKQ